VISTSTWHTVAGIAIGVCWGTFLVVWIAGALYNARRGPAVRTRRMGNLRWVIAVAAAWAVLRLVPGSDWDRLSLQTSWIRLPGLVLLVGATAFTIWARFSLGKMWSSDVVAKEGHELRTNGPYGIVRHPIYAGLLGMLLGSAMLDGFGVWTLALIGGGAMVLLKVRAEEGLMSNVFPRDYERYRRRVPALIPSLRRR
jgi:protein-S-isoprenylcysteine O-methyltransferase Ste14